MDKPSKFEAPALEIDDGKTKWTGQQVGVNSNIPLVNDGTGKPYIIRQFDFAFDPNVLIKIKQKKIPVPTKQELFNSNWHQIRITLWGDGLIAIEDELFPPRIVIGRKKYKIILVCEPRFRTMVADKPQTLQEITKPLTN